VDFIKLLFGMMDLRNHILDGCSSPMLIFLGGGINGLAKRNI